MKFLRVGGLSAIRQRGNYKVKDTYHSAPEKYGLYAFIYPYFEPFLALWSERNRREFDTHGYRIFEYDGNIWTHLQAPNICLERGGWYRAHTSDLKAYMSLDCLLSLKG